MKLKTEINTRAMESRIYDAALVHFNLTSKRGMRAAFEHGQWWLTLGNGSQFSVVDAEGPGSTDGFDFEMVKEPTE